MPQSAFEDVLNADSGAIGILRAFDKSNAIIAFDLNTNILAANENFLATMGYDWDEVKGKQHRIFAHDDLNEAKYRQFWDDLRNGKFCSGEFRRRRKDGKDVWIAASYNPVLGKDGSVTRIVKIATDITERKIALDQVVNGLAELAEGNVKVRLDNN
ncbi:MAG: PAS domain-containing protein, partial [Pseudomonadota bacterium]